MRKSIPKITNIVKIIIIIIVIIIILQSKFRKTRLADETAETYFLAGRSMMWWAVSKQQDYFFLIF